VQLYGKLKQKEEELKAKDDEMEDMQAEFDAEREVLFFPFLSSHLGQSSLSSLLLWCKVFYRSSDSLLVLLRRVGYA
jgi:hypothetical protein